MKISDADLSGIKRGDLTEDDLLTLKQNGARVD
jgi:hypothetical protein